MGWVNFLQSIHINIYGSGKTEPLSSRRIIASSFPSTDSKDSNTPYYDDAEDFAWESVYVHFDVSVFCYQLFLHLFLPFTIFMSPSPKAQMMWLDRNAPFGQVVVPVMIIMLLSSMTFVSVLMYEFLPDADRAHWLGAVAYPILFSIMWKLSVATKYAMFSPSEYKKVLTFKSWEAVRAYMRQTLIGSNFIDRQDDHVNRFEISASAFRGGVKNIHLIKFKLENPNKNPMARRRMKEWSKFLCASTPTLHKGNASNRGIGLVDTDILSDTIHKDMLGPEGYHFDLLKQEDGTFELPLYDLCRHVQIWAHKEAIKALSARLSLIASIATAVVALIPFFSMIDGSYKTLSRNTACFLFFSTFDCLFFLNTILARFMYGAIIDYHRQYIMQRAFNDFLRATEYDNEMRITIEGHWSALDRKYTKKQTMIFGEDVYKNTQQQVEQESNKRVVKVFHIAREKETKKRLRQSSIRDMLITIKEEEKKEREGGGDGTIDDKVVQGTSTPITDVSSGVSSGSSLVVGGGVRVVDDVHSVLSNLEDGLSQFHGSFVGGVGLHPDSGIPVHHIHTKQSNRAVRETTHERERRQSLDSVVEDWNDETDGIEGEGSNHIHVIHDHEHRRRNSTDTNSIKSNSVESFRQFSLWDNPEHHEYDERMLANCDDRLMTDRRENEPQSTSREPDFIDFPRLSLAFESNIFAWVSARQVMTTFKIRFRRRIEVVCAIVMAATIAVIASCFGIIYSSDDIVSAYSSPLILQTIVVVTVFSTALIKYCSEAARINNMFQLHQMSIRQHQILIHGQIANCSLSQKPETLQKLKMRNEALEACANYIESTNKNQPSEVFGITADSRLTFSVISGLISFYVTLTSIYYYNSGGAKVLPTKAH